jgi:predicted N-formylglutamate amidohydrolase
MESHWVVIGFLLDDDEKNREKLINVLEHYSAMKLNRNREYKEMSQEELYYAFDSLGFFLEIGNDDVDVPKGKLILGEYLVGIDNRKGLKETVVEDYDFDDLKKLVEFLGLNMRNVRIFSGTKLSEPSEVVLS